MAAGAIIMILSFGIPILIVIGIIWWIKRDFTSLSKWAQESKRRQAPKGHPDYKKKDVLSGRL